MNSDCSVLLHLKFVAVHLQYWLCRIIFIIIYNVIMHNMEFYEHADYEHTCLIPWTWPLGCREIQGHSGSAPVSEGTTSQLQYSYGGRSRSGQGWRMHCHYQVQLITHLQGWRRRKRGRESESVLHKHHFIAAGILFQDAQFSKKLDLLKNFLLIIFHNIQWFSFIE